MRVSLRALRPPARPARPRLRRDLVVATCRQEDEEIAVALDQIFRGRRGAGS